MSRSEIVERILSAGVIAVIRMRDAGRARNVVEALLRGGVTAVEITMTVPGAPALIADLRRQSDPRVLIGAGTVVGAESARAVIQSGAQFLVSPIFEREVLEAGHAAGLPVIPGCFTPAEIHAAWSAGADIVKVFPSAVLGPRFFRDLRGPFPDIRLMPTGGVTIDNVGEWVAAGACAVGIGGDLIAKELVEKEAYGALTERAAELVRNFRIARGEGGMNNEQ